MINSLYFMTNLLTGSIYNRTGMPTIYFLPFSFANGCFVIKISRMLTFLFSFKVLVA